MKRRIQCFALGFVVMLTVNATCQNGPTPPSATLSWTQSPATGIIENNVYRCTETGTTACTPGPVSSCTSCAVFTLNPPVLAYADKSVANGSSYCYAVTASTSTVESGYSNVVCGSVGIASPSGLNDTSAKNGNAKSDIVVARLCWGTAKCGDAKGGEHAN